MKRAFFALVPLLLASAASAQGYIGIATGPTQHKLDCSGTTSCDTTDTGYKLYGGYKFSPIAAVELGYTDFGRATKKLGTASATYTATSFWIGGAVFVLLAPQLKGIARLGISSSEAEVSETWWPFSVSNSKTHTNPYVGLGLGYDLTPQMSLTAHFDFARIKYNNSDSADTSFLSIGLSQAF